MTEENLKKLLLAACAMVTTEDPTSGSYLSEILFAAADDGAAPVAGHFTSRTFSHQSQTGGLTQRHLITALGKTDTLCSVVPATPRRAPRGSDALTLGWEVLRKRSGTVSDDHLRGQPELCFQKDPEDTEKEEQTAAERPRPRRDLGWMERSSFQTGREARWSPLGLSAAPTAPRGRNFRGAVRSCSSVDSLKENGNK
ncbi:hypothetical protein Celaphus_00019287, partial [Cervus elaphus hippelaphus]